MTFDLKKLFGNIADKKIIYILGAIGIVLIYISSLIPSEKKSSETVIVEKDYCVDIEQKLEEILPKIAGVGRVDVMITAKNDGKITLAKDKEENSEKTIVLNQKGGGENTQILSESYPEIQGIIVVADGGGNVKTQEKLTSAVMALLNLDAHRIKVFERTID